MAEHRLRWLGHSAWQLETGDFRVLIDPFLSDNPVACVAADSLEPTHILVSHGHGDHVGDTVELAVRTGATVVANHEICEWLTAKGVKNLHPMNLGGGHDFPFGRVKMTIAHHSSMLPDGSDGGCPGGFLLRLSDGRKIYYAGDTALFYDMLLIGQVGLDIAILPIGDNYTMGPSDALRAVELLRPKLVLPCHYNTWPPIAQDAEAWIKDVRQLGKTNALALRVGDTHVLS